MKKGKDLDHKTEMLQQENRAYSSFIMAIYTPTDTVYVGVSVTLFACGEMTTGGFCKAF